MHELKHLIGNTYYIDGESKIGVYVYGENAILIDSGASRADGEAAAEILDAHGWKLQAVLNTHSHADHIGGNAVLREKTGCAIYAKDVECGFIRHTMVTPSFLIGGYPYAELRCERMMAKNTPAVDFAEFAGMPEGVEIFPLKGHVFDMAGVKTPDGVYFISDSLRSAETLDRFPVSCVFDVREYLGSLDTLKGYCGKAKYFVPTHLDVMTDISDLIERNRAAVLANIELILAVCAEPKDSEQVIQEVCRKYQAVLTFPEYALAGSAVRSYLAYLHDNGKIAAEFSDFGLFWKTV